MKIILAFILFASISFAATSGSINSTSTNSTGIVTGMWGSTFNFYCNTNATCEGTDRCILDYDDYSATFSGANYKGWCTSSSETRCRHNDTYYSSGSKLCDSGARSCSNGVWTTTTCTANQTCTSGECVASSSSPVGGGSSTSPTTTTPPPNPSGLDISLPSDFNITQGESALKEISVKNTGNITLPAVSLSLGGIDWYNVTPKSASIPKNFSVTFTVNFTAPENAEVKEYSVAVTAQNGSTLASKTFKIRVLPSNKTVESSIIPLYNEYVSNLSNLENRIAELKNKGTDVSELQNILNTIKDKLNQTNSSLSNQDYFAANVFLNDIKQLISDFEAKASAAKPQEFNILFIIIPVVIGVAAVLAYLFWPTKRAV